MGRGIIKGKVSWAITICLAIILVISAFGGSIFAAEAISSPLEYTFDDAEVGVRTGYTLEFDLIEGQTLGIGDTVYLQTYTEEGAPGEFSFDDPEYPATVRVSGTDCPDILATPSGFTITIPSEFGTIAGGQVEIELENVVNPTVAGAYYWELGINNNANQYCTELLTITPGPPAKLRAHLHQSDVYDGIKIRDPNGNPDTSKHLPGAQELDDYDDEAADEAYPFQYPIVPFSNYDGCVGLADEYGNSLIAPLDQEFEVYLSTDGYLDVLFTDANGAPMAADTGNPFTLTPGHQWTEFHLATTGVYPYGCVFFESSDLECYFSINIEVLQPEPAGLALYVENRLNTNNYNDDGYFEGGYWEVNREEESWILNDTYTRVIVGLVDDMGRPTRWNGSILPLPVTLHAPEGGGFAWEDTYGTIFEDELTIEIPNGYNGVELYYIIQQEYPESIGNTYDLTAAAVLESEESPVPVTATFTVGIFPHWFKLLAPGWNVISTPMALEKDLFDQSITTLAFEEDDTITGPQDFVEVVYSFNSTTQQWHQIYQVATDHAGENAGRWVVQQGVEPNQETDPLFLLNPMEAIYVKIKDNFPSASLFCYADSSSTEPYASNLKTGWNLVGPAGGMDFVFPLSQFLYVPIQDFLSPESEAYAECVKVVSPGNGYYPPWSYSPGQDDSIIKPVMAGGGIWINVKNPTVLPGLVSNQLSD